MQILIKTLISALSVSTTVQESLFQYSLNRTPNLFKRLQLTLCTYMSTLNDNY